MTSTSKVAFVRATMLPEQAPPPGVAGPVKWLRENLFSGWFNSLMTVLAIYIVWSVL